MSLRSPLQNQTACSKSFDDGHTAFATQPLAHPLTSRDEAILSYRDGFTNVVKEDWTVINARDAETPTISRADEFLDICRVIRQSFNRVPPELAQQDELSLRFAPSGKRVPIFWCFNSWSEPILLSNRLGPDQPITAMCSLHGIVRGKATKMAHSQTLSKLYGDLLLEAVPDDTPILIGGNCQAAPIAEAMAHHVIAQSGRVPLLMLLEHVPFYCYPGSLLMLFGNQSPKYNPFLRGPDPRQRWSAQHRRAAWGFLNGQHGRYFVDPALQDLTRYLLTTTEAFCLAGDIAPGGPDPVVLSRL